MRILIVSFSARQDGNCDGVSRMIQEHFDHSCTVFRFSQQQIHPCGGCRYECFGKDKPCPYIADPEYGLLDAICNHDLTYFVIPNYCDYPCANYFIFIERSQCYFQHKPEQLDRFLNVKKKFIVISNTNQDNFRQILRQNVYCEPEILFLSAKKFDRISIHGDLLTSDAAAEIEKLILNCGNG